MKVARIGIDLAKSVFQIHGVDRSEHTVLTRQLKRNQMLAFFQNLEPCLIGMEACAKAVTRSRSEKRSTFRRSRIIGA